MSCVLAGVELDNEKDIAEEKDGEVEEARGSVIVVGVQFHFIKDA